MNGRDRPQTVGALPDSTDESSRVPAILTRLTWLLCLASVGALVLRVRADGAWAVDGLLAVDGLTVVLWVAVTGLSGLVQSYARRYMVRTAKVARFFGRVVAFTVIVLVLVAADSLVLFGAAWLAMGLVMAGLIGHVDGWTGAEAAAALARRSFLASSSLLAVALATLWWATGATTVSGVASAVTGPSPALLVAAGLLLLAAMIQSALVPFQTWLLSSMTAPTPASALMHAGFVNAGGILLVRFSLVMTLEAGVMLLVVLVGATSALLGKLLKSVQVDVKTQLGCSTTGQMGFMLMQAGLGFFAAAITHLLLHGLYKGYLFLSVGESIEQTGPERAARERTGTGPVGALVTVATALGGGAVFAGLTGKGTALDSGLLLTGLVVLTTMHATLETVRREGIPTTVRYVAMPAIALPAVAAYALVYNGIAWLMTGVPVVTAPAELGLVHGLVAVAFLGAYVAIETGLYQHSERLYVALVNASRPARGTAVTAREDYNEF